ncbi:MAG: PIN domain-containing protein [Nanoarchaeota archaeon]
MKIILDVNSIISALIKDSISRKIIKESGFDFYFPEIAFNKIIKYKNYLIEKSQITEEEFVIVLSVLLNKIKIIPQESLEPYLEKARKIIGKIDEEDIIFIASALSIDNCIVWSDDRHFEKQNIINVIKTKDLIKYVKDF